MKEEIDWKKELLESGRFNDKFSRGLLENGAKIFISSPDSAAQFNATISTIGL